MHRKKRVLITNARTFIALDLARLFHLYGIEVFVADSLGYHICSHSNAIKKKFHVPSPRFESESYVEAVAEIVREYQIDLVLPVYEEIFYLAKGLRRFPKKCKILVPSFEILETLHNKYTFQQKLNSLGISIPKTHVIKSNEDLKNIPLEFPFILKPCYGRASQKIIKVNHAGDTPKTLIDSQQHWVAQEWLEGKKYCTYSICQDGKVNAHATYPVEYSIEGNSCLTFKSVEHPGVLKWVEKFARLENFSGQIGFDFIERSNGELFAIECNPRATSGLHLLSSEKRLIDIFFGEELDYVMKPKDQSIKQIGVAMLLYGWNSSSSLMEFFKSFFSFKDVIFDRKDYLPFLFQPCLFGYYFLRSLKLKLNFPAMFTHDIDWNGTLESEKKTPFFIPNSVKIEGQR